MVADEWDDSADETYQNPSVRARKRRRVYRESSVAVHRENYDPFSLLLSGNSESLNSPGEPSQFFEDVLEGILPELIVAHNTARETLLGHRSDGPSITLLTRADEKDLADTMSHNTKSRHGPPPVVTALINRKLQVRPGTLRRKILNNPIIQTSSESVSPMPPMRSVAANPQVLDALHAIRTTPYERSFLSRIQGYQSPAVLGLMHVDWETRSPWMELLSDIREHYALAHPEHAQPVEVVAPITYMSLHSSHLSQVHDLLTRTFWEGINVSDSLQNSPEKCTIVAAYKKLVVGAAFISSPQETYITYLVVRAGWENCQIATTMLYHLITLNPNKDITLHVSINNPAMLLYNRFGFKAEEFIVGFYEDYLDPESRASKNAFRLRLRR
ncbi:hypothetical protein WOLCODRAFT_139002 [Wolfiporia cocos MD-104 SS10]|uniref:N-acetyltransferase domain-containing protein n=1 Tax=Wolfiporia cocos (strain MD-104) TaxID=742152 RepID=A0A2H3JSH4_WOLCO|nr:hypothetical protein WOLCODRAFT_139002 [Wolfiporia cocos MD-104 SS10]